MKDRISTEIRSVGGVPRLHVDGAVHNGLTFHHNGFVKGRHAYERALSDLRRMYAAGVRMVSTDALIEVREDAALEFAASDRWMADLAAVGPDLLAVLRLPVWQGESWLAGRPDHRKRHRDAATGEPLSGGSPSFSSEAWRSDACAWLREAVLRCEERYGDRTAAYIPAGELCYHREEALSDFSPVQERAFRVWLRRRYGESEAALRRAWAMEDAGFESASVPADRLRRPGDSCLLVPGTPDQRIIDYLIFHNAVFADALVEMCAAIKAALAEAGSHKIVGTFCGYHFFDVGRTASFHNSGQHAVERVLASPDVDFMAVVHSHQERHPGGMWMPQMPLASCGLRGKFVFQEEDTATHRAQPLSWQRPCPDLRSTLGALTRNLAGALAAGGSQWWHDFSGEGWYGDPEIAAHVAQLVEIARRAGVHVYVDTGDQVIGRAGLLAVHAASSGERTVRLPGSARVTDAFTGRALADGQTFFGVRLEAGDTLLARW